jgi:membrane-associated phospholipid phosphatase
VERFRHGRRKIAGGPLPGAQPVWTPAMTVIAWTAALLVIALSFVDGDILAFVRGYDTPLRTFMRDWTDLVRSQWYLVPAVLLIIIAGLADWGEPDSGARRVWSSIYAQAVFVLVGVGGALLTTNIFKIIFGRARPVLFDQFGHLHLQPFTLAYDYASFPSGHSTTAAALTVILMTWLPRFRWLFLAAGLFMAATRIAAEAHYPSDTVGGFAVGFLFTLALARWLAAHGMAFRTEAGTLLPVPRFRSQARQHLPPS